jgi:nucleoside-diphosphate-sugar epimerase
MQALDKNPALSGRVYFISDDDPIPLWDMVNRILEAGGCPPVTRRVSNRLAYAVGTALELIYRTFKLSGEPKMTRFVARELATSHWFDISAAKRDLNYAATISIDEGMQRLKAWLVENGS